jgi:hypothetical protein
MSATNGSNLVRMGISPVGRETFKYPDLISAVHHMQSSVTAICIMNAKVSGFLRLDSRSAALAILRAASWSSRAAPRALCLSVRPIPFFLCLHLRVFPICSYFFIALTSSVETGTSVPVVPFVRSRTFLRIASLNCSVSGALIASRVDMFLLFSSSSGTDSISRSWIQCGLQHVIYGYNAGFVMIVVSLHVRVDLLDNVDALD